MLRGPGGLEPLLFGNGFHGSMLFSGGSTVLSGDIYAEDVTISEPVTPNGYRIFARDFIKITDTGSLFGNGSSAINNVGGLSVGGVIIDPGSNGVDGSAGIAGTAGSLVTLALGGPGGSGGASSSTLGGAGGSGINTLDDSFYNILTPLSGGFGWDGSVPFGRLYAGQSGGAGGGHAAGVGGGSGAGGAGIILAAPHIIIDAGFIFANGGTGGNGSPTMANNGGGGGGGGGGWVMLVYGKLEIINAGQIFVNGGDGGNGGTTAFGGAGGLGGKIIHYTNGYLVTRREFGNDGSPGTP